MAIHPSPALIKVFAEICAMRIDVITVLPELLESPLSHSIMKRARAKGLLEVHLHPLRQWAVNEYGQVDDYQYGGGAGMVMMCEPLANAIEQLQKERTYDEVSTLPRMERPLTRKQPTTFHWHKT